MAIEEVTVINLFPVITVRMHAAIAKVIERVALDLMKDAQDLTPVQTGFLRSSIHVETATQATYGDAQEPPTDDVYLLPPAPRPADDMEAYVGVAANYGVYVEMGTRHMAPEPYFFPAVEIARVNLEGRFSVIESQLGGL